jgi:hypothetical protein
MTLAEEFDNRGVEAVERRPHAEAAGEFDDLDSVQSFRINIQRRHPPCVPGLARVVLIDTPVSLCYSARTT